MGSGRVELILIRHAAPVAGGDDPGLSDWGRRQAIGLGAWLADETIDHILSSPQRRAHETASLAFTAHEIEVRDELREWEPSAMLAALSDHGDPSARAAFSAFRERLRALIAELTERFEGCQVAAVCHGGVINTIVTDVLGIDRPAVLIPDYTSIHRLTMFRGAGGTVQSLNETPHLRLLQRETRDP